MKKFAESVLLLCFAGSSAHAIEAEYSKQFTSCMDQAGGGDSAMQDCIQDETKRQDARLNKNYQALTVSLPAARKKHLQTAQRLWIQYRDANCRFYFDPDGGTAARVASTDCLMQMTASRAKELESFKE